MHYFNNIDIYEGFASKTNLENYIENMKHFSSLRNLMKSHFILNIINDLKNCVLCFIIFYVKINNQ